MLTLVFDLLEAGELNDPSYAGYRASVDSPY